MPRLVSLSHDLGLLYSSYFHFPIYLFSTSKYLLQNCIIHHKTGLNRYKKTEIIPCVLSDHHGLRLVFNNNENNRKPTHTWKLNNAHSMMTWSREK